MELCSTCSTTFATNTNEESTTTALKPSNQKKLNGFAIAGFVASFFSPLLGCTFGGIGLGTLSNFKSGKGLSISALIISFVNFCIRFFLIYLLFLNLYAGLRGCSVQ